jgi:polo-like kinase 1
VLIITLLIRTLCGTPNYIAPEVLNKVGHSFEVDVWSIGCILYTLLVGRPPFETTSLKETYQRIRNCEYSLSKAALSLEASNLIRRMLQTDPKARPSVKQLLADPFFTAGNLIGCFSKRQMSYVYNLRLHAEGTADHLPLSRAKV